MDGIIVEGKDIYFKGTKVYYTDLKLFLRASEIDPLKYNWIIYQYECNYYPSEVLEQKRHSSIWLTGTEVNDLIANENLQFIWGIIVGYTQDVSEESVLKLKTPDYSRNPVSDGLNEIEIHAIDSTSTKIFSKEKKHIEQIKKSFPTAILI